MREAVKKIYEMKENTGADEFFVIASGDRIIFRFGKGDKSVSDSLSLEQAEAIWLSDYLIRLEKKLEGEDERTDDNI